MCLNSTTPTRCFDHLKLVSDSVEGPIGKVRFYKSVIVRVLGKIRVVVYGITCIHQILVSMIKTENGGKTYKTQIF